MLGDISIIEFGVYGLVTYSSLLMLIISTIKEVPDTKSKSILRSIYFIPAMICAIILAGSGVDITLNTVDTTNLINDTDAQIFSEITQRTDKITLLNPIWGLVHVMIFLTMLVYVINQMLLLLTRTK